MVRFRFQFQILYILYMLHISLDFDRQNLAEVIPIRPRLNAIKEEHVDPVINHLPKEVRNQFTKKTIHVTNLCLGYKSY